MHSRNLVTQFHKPFVMFSKKARELHSLKLYFSLLSSKTVTEYSICSCMSGTFYTNVTYTTTKVEVQLPKYKNLSLMSSFFRVPDITLMCIKLPWQFLSHRRRRDNNQTAQLYNGERERLLLYTTSFSTKRKVTETSIFWFCFRSKSDPILFAILHQATVVLTNTPRDISFLYETVYNWKRFRRCKTTEETLLFSSLYFLISYFCLPQGSS